MLIDKNSTDDLKMSGTRYARSNHQRVDSILKTKLFNAYFEIISEKKRSTTMNVSIR